MGSSLHSTIKINRITRSFWTLNDEMHPAHKVNFVREIDATPLDRYREKIQTQYGMKPSYTALITKAAAKVLGEFPLANRAIIGPPLFRKMVQFNAIDITVAVERNVPDAEAVVLADTIRDVPNKSVVDVTTELQQLAVATMESNERWRLFMTLLSRFPVFITKWLIRMPRFSARMWTKHRGCACFVNSPAKYGIDLIMADMIWPLTISFGWIRKRPFVVDNSVEARKTMPLIMIFDRRIMAGAPAARFFNRLAEILENIETEL